LPKRQMRKSLTPVQADVLWKDYLNIK